MKFLQLRSFWNRVDHMWSGVALGYSVFRDDWKSALQFRKKEKWTRKMPEGFQTTSFPRKRRPIRADPIQAEIDSILSFLYSRKTTKVKIKRGEGPLLNKSCYTHTHSLRLVVDYQWLAKRILCEIRQEESRQTNKQTHTRWGWFRKRRKLRDLAELCWQTKWAVWGSCFAFGGYVGRILHLGRFEKREENKKVQTARRREKNGAKRTKDKENDRSESEIINSGSSWDHPRQQQQRQKRPPTASRELPGWMDPGWFPPLGQSRLA